MLYTFRTHIRSACRERYESVPFPVSGPPDDIVEFDDDLFDTETETIDKISFVYGPPPEIIHYKLR